MRTTFCLLGLTWILAGCYETNGIAAFGTVQGYAQDVSNGVLVGGVSVAIAGDTTRTLPDGTFRFDRVKAGTHLLSAAYADFEPFNLSVVVHERRNTSVPVLLSPGGFSIGQPAAIAAEPGQLMQAITVTWTPLEEAVAYALYWSTSPSVAPTSANRINGVSPPFVHTNLNVTQTYYYAIAALGIVAEGPASAVVSSTPREHIAIRIDEPPVGALAVTSVNVSVRVLSNAAVASVSAELDGTTTPLTYIADFNRWQGTIPAGPSSTAGTPLLTITARDAENRVVHANRMLRRQ